MYHFTVSLPVVIALAVAFCIVAPRIGERGYKFSPLLLTIVLACLVFAAAFGFSR